MVSLKESILSSTNAGKNSIGIGDWKIGMILSAPFQYSARFNYFYEIVGVSGKATVIVKELEKKSVHDDGYGQNGEEVPILGSYVNDGQTIKCRVDRRGYLKIRNNYAHEWKGNPEPYYSD